MRLRAAFARTLDEDGTLRVRAPLRLDMQNSSQERRRQKIAPGSAQHRAATTQTPRRPIGAGGGEELSRSGSVPVITTHALFARKVQRKLSNGVAGFSPGGSSLDEIAAILAIS